MDAGTAAEFDLETFLPYLLNQAAEATSLAFETDYRGEYGLSRAQWRVMANLGRFGAMTASQICRRTHEEKTRVSRSVQALADRGWLRREAVAGDRRSERLSLTAEGRAVFDRLGARAAAFDRALRARLGPEAAALEGLLRRLAAR